MTDRTSRKFKVVLLGEGRVGKTSILLRYIKGEYNDQQVSTLQASYLDKKLMVDSSKVQLSIWDTAGQERFHALGPIYYRDADGAVLVYDITDDESFRKVRTWVRELRRIVGEDIDISIAGNKVDLQRNRKVEESTATKYAESVGASHIHTSAKLNKGLDDVFVDLTKRMLQRANEKKAKKQLASGLITDDDDTVVGSKNSQASNSKRSGASGTTKKGAREDAAMLEPQRVRTGGRGQHIPIVDDYDDDQESLGNQRSSASGIKIRGVSHVEGHGSGHREKAKGGCC